MDSWLNGELPEEEPPAVPSAPKRTVVASAESRNNDSAPLTAMLKSEAFKALVRETVVEVLNSKEGRQMIANGAEKAGQHGITTLFTAAWAKRRPEKAGARRLSDRSVTR